MMNRKRLLGALAGVSLAISAGLVGVAASPAVATAIAVAPATATTTTEPTSPPSQVVVPPTPDPKRDKPQRGTTGRAGKGKAPAPGEASTFTACASPCFSYAAARRSTTAAPVIAASVGIRVAQPTVESGDFHSLAEMSVQNAGNVVEVGWTVDAAGVNGADHTKPHLFVSGWYNTGSGQTWCGSYNGGCGWTDYGSNPLNAGADISADLSTTTPQVIVMYSAGNWWVYYKSDWVGYFPAHMGHGVVGFSSATLIQNFGEVATTRLPSCSDMGNGNFPSASGSYPAFGADFYNLNTMLTTAWAGAPYNSTYVTDPTKWDQLTIGDRSMRYGGPGAAAGTCP